MQKVTTNLNHLARRAPTKNYTTSFTAIIKLSHYQHNSSADGHLPRPDEGLTTHVLLLDVEVLKNPVAHVPHSGWVVAVPDTVVYLPGGHLVWATQELALLPLDAEVLKKPAAHVAHVGCLVPCAVLIYFPEGHSID